MVFYRLSQPFIIIGSGALKVLGMDWAMNLPMKVTTTSSNFMIGITAATGSSIYWYEGYINLFIAAATAIGVLIGAYFGAKNIHLMFSFEILTRTFAPKYAPISTPIAVAAAMNRFIYPSYQ